MIKRWGCLIKDRRASLIVLGLVFLVNFFVFFPAFSHLMRADQGDYLIETAGEDSFWGLVRQSYSYPRTREIEAGDQVLFRPVLFSLLACGTKIFRYDFVSWQLASFFLHLLVLTRLHLILRCFYPSLLAGFLVLAFSVMFVSQEMVIWHHIAGYLLFAVFFLQAFYCYMRYVESQQQRPAYFWGMVLLLGLAALTYEFGVLCCFVFCGMLWVQFLSLPKAKQEQVRVRPNFVLLPVVVYGFWSLTDYIARVEVSVGEGWALSWESFWSGLSAVLGIMGQGLFFPSLTTILWANRSTFVPFSEIPGYPSGFLPQVLLLARKAPGDLWAGLNLSYLVTGALFLLGLLIVISKTDFRAAWRRMSSEDRGIFGHRVFVFGAMLVFGLLYVLMIVTGRFMSRGVTALHINLYYFYFILLFAGIAGYFGFFMVYPFLGKGRRLLLFALGLALLSSAGVNGYRSYQFNLKGRAYAFSNRSFARYLWQVNHFVQEHKSEPGFSFGIYWSDVYFHPVQSLGPKYDGREYTELLFTKYLTPNPKYHMVYSNGHDPRFFRTTAAARKYIQDMGLDKKVRRPNFPREKVPVTQQEGSKDDKH